MFDFLKEKEIKKYSIELLKKHYIVDEENKVVTIKLQYDNATDLLDDSIGETVSLNDEIFNKMLSLIEKIPNEYSCHFKFVLNDFNGYDVKELTDLFEDYFASHYIATQRNLKFKKISSLLLLLSGLLFLILAISSLSFKWFNNENLRTIINETLDIVAWVFIWEAATIFYIDSFALKAKQKMIKRRIKSISIVSSNENDIATLKNEQLFDEESKDLINIIKETKK